MTATTIRWFVPAAAQFRPISTLFFTFAGWSALIVTGHHPVFSSRGGVFALFSGKRSRVSDYARFRPSLAATLVS